LVNRPRKEGRDESRRIVGAEGTGKRLDDGWTKGRGTFFPAPKKKSPGNEWRLTYEGWGEKRNPNGRKCMIRPLGAGFSQSIPHGQEKTGEGRGKKGGAAIVSMTWTKEKEA